MSNTRWMVQFVSQREATQADPASIAANDTILLRCHVGMFGSRKLLFYAA